MEKTLPWRLSAIASRNEACRILVIGVNKTIVALIIKGIEEPNPNSHFR